MYAEDLSLSRCDGYCNHHTMHMHIFTALSLNQINVTEISEHGNECTLGDTTLNNIKISVVICLACILTLA